MEGGNEMTKAAMLTHLQHLNLACRGCDLRSGLGGCVFGEGNVDSSVVFVGREAFAQRTEVLLHQILQEAGFDTQDVYITNILKCRPSRKPTLSHMETCLPWLRKQYRILKPSVMVLLGLTTAQTILDKDITLKQFGQWFQRGDTMMMPIYHPGSLLTSPLRREICVEYLRKVKEVCKGCI